ncbi:MAG: hypothetical protein U0796_01260 [Gemmatales bacterium]
MPVVHQHRGIDRIYFLTGCLLVVIPGISYGQGSYTPVTAEQVAKLKLNHYFTADKKYQRPEFTWTFTATEFVIKKGEGAIPSDLLNKLLTEGVTAEEIRGSWKLTGKENQELVLTEIKAGKQVGKKEVRLHLYKTAPTVVRIGEPQYVFAIGL